MQRKCSKYSDVLIVESEGSSLGRLIAESLASRGVWSSFCDNTRKLNETDFVRQIKETVAERQVSMIIPVFHPEILARHREEFPGILIPIDSEHKLTNLDNKVYTAVLAESLGILQPHAYPDIDSVESYPVVFKRASGHGGDSVYFPKIRRSLENLVGSSKPGSFLITEEIDGKDVSVDAIRWDGYFHAEAYEVILPKAKGISILRKSIAAPEIVEAAQKILESIDFKGVCGMDFRLGEDGRHYFLECNPRFSGGLCSQIASGFDMPWILWQLAHGEEPSPVRFRNGVKTQYVKGTLDYLKRRRKQGRLTFGDILECMLSGAVKFG